MNFHNLTRSLAIAGVGAIGVRSSQLHWGTSRWTAVIPEWLILPIVLAALLFAPVLVLTEFLSTRPRVIGKSLCIDLAFIATVYVCFLFYMRFA